jgi:cell wall-associated NlpC family hydrolase
LKVKKIEDKPMVIHTKKKPSLHLHTGKKAVVRKKAENTSVTVKRRKPHPGIRDKMAESGKSVKVRNQSLKTMAAAGARAGAGQIEGGEEIKESLDLAAAATAPAVGIASGAGKLYRRKKAKNKEKRAEIKKKQGRKDAGQAENPDRSRKNAGNKKRDRNGKKRDGKKDSSGKKRGKGSVNGAVKGHMIDTFLDTFQTERAEQKDLITSTKSAAKAAALLLAKQAAVALAPLLLMVFFVIAIAGIIVVAILAVIYNSPLAIFFPLPDTGYDNPRTVLSEYYRDFNSGITALEEQGYTVTYQNSEDGVPVSNFNDTLMVYMVKYGTGQAAYVMDEEGKKHLKEVFDEMNYYDSASSKTEIPAGKSLGEVVTTGYCNCSLCCGKWAGGHTASGTVPKADHTLAVDAHSPKVPMGTKIVMNGKTYKVEDTGNFARYGTDFDIYFGSHAAAQAWGKRKVEAFLAEGNENTVEVTVSGTLVHNLTYKDYLKLDKLTEEQKDWLESIMGDDMQENFAIGTGGQAVAELAMTKIGCQYSQDKRYQEGYYDCSSLVQRLYKEAGITLPATAATQGKYCYDNAMIINKKQLKPGDLIFYSYEENGEFRNISHVAIYVGDGKMVHAANPSRGVVLDPLRTNSVVFYARPY